MTSTVLNILIICIMLCFISYQLRNRWLAIAASADQQMKEPPFKLIVKANDREEALNHIDVPQPGEMHGFAMVRSISAMRMQDDPTLWEVSCEFDRKYRPFANANEYKPHCRRILRSLTMPSHYLIPTFFNNYGCARNHLTYDELLKNWVFDDDGSPCGVPE